MTGTTENKMQKYAQPLDSDNNPVALGSDFDCVRIAFAKAEASLENIPSGNEKTNASNALTLAFLWARAAAEGAQTKDYASPVEPDESGAEEMFSYEKDGEWHSVPKADTFTDGGKVYLKSTREMAYDPTPVAGLPPVLVDEAIDEGGVVEPSPQAEPEIPQPELPFVPEQG